MKVAELRKQKPAELSKLLTSTQKDLADARRGLAAGELVNPRVITTHRKTIARIMTVMSEQINKEEEN
ncbi:50S ribosomal protein L29 [Candidatus Saccharibacteria bacterium]|nr:MAG: 50S ribosomal protein L29 [Candidatus Saccharibacteria bacterium]